MASAADVPEKFDVVINGKGYLFAPSDVGLPPSIFGVKNKFGYTPTFINRQNVSGDFGDNQQDFWLTATQRDWSLGEQQRYFKQSDQDAVRRYWQGTNVDAVTTPGQIQIRRGGKTTSSVGATVTGAGQLGNGSQPVIADATNLYYVNADGTTTSKGAHGLTNGPSMFGIAGDQSKTYLSNSSQNVRAWNGVAFSTFSANGAYSLAYLNNTLYGFDGANLFRWDSAGNQTTIFTWKNADGTNFGTGGGGKILPFGGDIAIGLFHPFPHSLWIYNGIAPAIIAQFPGNFWAQDVCVSLGTIFVAGYTLDEGRSVIYYWSNGTLGLLWKSSSTTGPSLALSPRIAPWADGIIFADPHRNVFCLYNAATGGISTVGNTGNTQPGNLSSAGSTAVLVDYNGLSTVAVYSDYYTNAVQSSGTVTTSLFDLDSSLNKLFRGIKVDFDSATDGNGGSVDIAYQVGSVDGSFTTLQTGATSGTEYLLSSIFGRSISVKVTLNKGTSTYGPALKRVAVRAVPIQTQFQNVQYVLYLGGEKRHDPIESQMMMLRDGTIHTKDGKDMAADLVAAATSTTPITITDSVNGTYTGVIDLSNFEIIQIKPREYTAVVGVRGV